MSQKQNLLLYDLFTVKSGRSAVHGGGVYGIELAKQLVAHASIQPKQWRLEFAFSDDSEIRNLLAPALAAGAATAHVVHSVDEVLRLAKSISATLVFTALPYNYRGALRELGAAAPKVVGVVHGLREFEAAPDRQYRSYLRDPRARLRLLVGQLMPRRNEARHSAQATALVESLGRPVLTDSEHSRAQLAMRVPTLSAAEVSVLRPIVQATDAEECPDDLQLPDNYALVLSADRPIKNATRVVEAFDRYGANALDHLHLVAIGFRPHQKRTLRRRYPRGFAKTVFLPYQSREVLNYILRRAACLVFPSLSEGFGYPPLEAMRVGTPVVVSGTSAIPELCGEAALYFDPHNIGEIALRIHTVTNDNTIRDRLVNLGKSRYEEYEKGIHNAAADFWSIVSRDTTPPRE